MKFVEVGLLFLAMVVSFSLVAGAQDEYDEALFEPELKNDQALILVTIQDKQGTPMSGVVLDVQQGFRGKKFSRVSDDKGKVVLIVDTGFTYHLRFLSLTSDKEGHSERFEINFDPEQRYSLVMTYDESIQKEFVLKGVHFDTGTATLKKSSFSKLKPLIEYMKLKPNIYVELSGHTDNQGDPEQNLNLSEARAEAVRQYLISQGIKASRIASTGYGDQKPIASNKTPEGRQKNRRTEVRIVD